MVPISALWEKANSALISGHPPGPQKMVPSVLWEKAKSALISGHPRGRKKEGASKQTPRPLIREKGLLFFAGTQGTQSVYGNVKYGDRRTKGKPRQE